MPNHTWFHWPPVVLYCFFRSKIAPYRLEPVDIRHEKVSWTSVFVRFVCVDFRLSQRDYSDHRKIVWNQRRTPQNHLFGFECDSNEIWRHDCEIESTHDVEYFLLRPLESLNLSSSSPLLLTANSGDCVHVWLTRVKLNSFAVERKQFWINHANTLTTTATLLKLNQTTAEYIE